jgi:hypothetical protein
VELLIVANLKIPKTLTAKNGTIVMAQIVRVGKKLPIRKGQAGAMEDRHRDIQLIHR